MNQSLAYTAKEAADAARVSLPTLYEWTRMDGFPAVRAGRKLVIPREAFKRWLEERASHDPRPLQ